MGLFSFLKRKPQPVDFKLRIVPRWSSTDGYVKFEYSKNGGRTWKTIRHAVEPLFHTPDYNWKWEPLTYSEGGMFEAEKARFSTLEKVQAYVSSERKRYEEGYKKVEAHWENVKRQKKEYYNKLNK